MHTLFPRDLKTRFQSTPLQFLRLAVLALAIAGGSPSPAGNEVTPPQQTIPTRVAASGRLEWMNDLAPINPLADTLVHAQPAASGVCRDEKMYSQALDLDLWYAIYLPPAYSDSQAARRYPVLYLLSGLGGNYREWAYDYDLCGQVERLIAQSVIQPLIVVMPSGNAHDPQEGYGGFWFNHAPDGFTCSDAIEGLKQSDGKRWGDYIWHDLVNFIDGTYHTLPRASGRAIGGMSAGGQAALTHALMHPDVFGVVGAHAPSQRRADCSVAFYGDPDYYKQYSPFELVQRTSATANLAIWIDEPEKSVWHTEIQALHSMLQVFEIEHAWRVLPGEHNPPYWQNHLEEYLRWYSAQLVGEND